MIRKPQNSVSNYLFRPLDYVDQDPSGVHSRESRVENLQQYLPFLRVQEPLFYDLSHVP